MTDAKSIASEYHSLKSSQIFLRTYKRIEISLNTDNAKGAKPNSKSQSNSSYPQSVFVDLVNTGQIILKT